MMKPALFLLSALTVFAPAGISSAADAKAEYIGRVSALPPRSADAHVELAEWCKQNGLEAQATQLLEKALSIDSDCEKARSALGYKRHGITWVKAGDKPPSFVRPTIKPASSSGEPTQPSPTAPAASGAKESTPTPEPATATESAGAGAKSSPETSTPEGTSTPEPTAKTVPRPGPSGPAAPAATKPQDTFAAEVEKKKAWAKSAAEKLQTTFNVYEDADFLVHSTLPTKAKEMSTLQLNLRLLKKTLAPIIGATGSTKIWPDKLQLVLLKSEPEYERFANLIDGMASAKNPEGAYVRGDHAVLHNPETEALPRFMGETALRRLGGSDRWVAWWLTEGIGELLFTQSPAGQKKEHYQNSMKYAGDVLKAEGETIKIYNLLDTADYKTKDSTRNRALALSLVDFLVRKNRSGFQDLIRQLKSESAPAPPAAGIDSKEEFSAFHLSYISFQEKTLESAFHMSISALQERWKAQTIQTADTLRAQESNKAKEDAKTKKAAKGTKGTGKKDG